MKLPPKLVHFPWNPSVCMGLIEMHRTTRDPRYLIYGSLDSAAVIGRFWEFVFVPAEQGRIIAKWTL